MKTIATKPPIAAKESPGFIKDRPTPKPSGKAIGELVGGRKELPSETRRKVTTRRGRTETRTD